MPCIRRKPVFKKEPDAFGSKKSSGLIREKTDQRGRDNPNKLIKKSPVRNPNKKN